MPDCNCLGPKKMMPVELLEAFTAIPNNNNPAPPTSNPVPDMSGSPEDSIAHPESAPLARTANMSQNAFTDDSS